MITTGKNDALDALDGEYTKEQNSAMGKAKRGESVRSKKNVGSRSSLPPPCSQRLGLIIISIRGQNQGFGIFKGVFRPKSLLLGVKRTFVMSIFENFRQTATAKLLLKHTRRTLGTQISLPLHQNPFSPPPCASRGEFLVIKDNIVLHFPPCTVD